ncbi:MurR/RpiR family transcriptional regulator [Kaustia mangrovi]|uniref:MurR/RpiR family transcriptional regulator n=1 Tax=Kaustia mangrovi TaxID=2593653 RepID=A0A7S8C325_9HYPH|nr:MurR/RpiR family transcriptional regulator [Kaustia mangrovi]QPC42471.1 MurR/RpiR family transcriptional regulator [Kaustia mangrovi]
MTVKSEIQAMSADLTSAERKIAAVVLADYPFGGLLTIQELAAKAHVSPPSITRFTAKLGCAGYHEFQRRLIDELKQSARRSPIDLRATQEVEARDGLLKDYVARVQNRLGQVTDTVSEADFDAICDMLADPRRAIFILGGRVSDSLGLFFSMSLRFLRRDIYHVPSNPELWPEYIQRMRSKDVVVLFDFRRYQPGLLNFAESLSEAAKPQIVLVTDQWLSPIAGLAARTIAMPIEVGTAWDTIVPPLAVLEAMVVKIAEDNWDDVHPRLQAWDRLRRRSSPPQSTQDQEPLP